MFCRADLLSFYAILFRSGIGEVKATKETLSFGIVRWRLTGIIAAMRFIPDIVIAAGLIVAAIGFWTDRMWVGMIALWIALVVGWQRKLRSGSRDSRARSAARDGDDSDTACVGDDGNGDHSCGDSSSDESD